MNIIKPFNTYVATLGEGPIYDERLDRLYFIDIEEKKLCYIDLPDTETKTIDLPSRPGTVILSPKVDIIYLLLEDGLNQFDMKTETLTWLSNPKEDMTGYRFNDGKCDPFGHIIVGAMHIKSPEKHDGTLYRIDPYGNFKIIDHNYHIPNGMAWDPDYRHFYCIDSVSRWVNRYDYDPITGSLSNFTHWISFKKESGVPDGMTRDKMGNLYIAHWGGNRISKWYPSNKEKLAEYMIDAEKITSATFYGKDYNRLFITSASVDMSENPKFKHCGQVFDMISTAKGYIVNYYDYKEH